MDMLEHGQSHPEMPPENTCISSRKPKIIIVKWRKQTREILRKHLRTSFHVLFHLKIIEGSMLWWKNTPKVLVFFSVLQLIPYTSTEPEWKQRFWCEKTLQDESCVWFRALYPIVANYGQKISGLFDHHVGQCIKKPASSFQNFSLFCIHNFSSFFRVAVLFYSTKVRKSAWTISSQDLPFLKFVPPATRWPKNVALDVFAWDVFIFLSMVGMGWGWLRVFMSNKHAVHLDLFSNVTNQPLFFLLRDLLLETS